VSAEFGGDGSPRAGEPFDGNVGVGLLALLVLGPVFLAGGALALLGILSVWGVEVGPLQEGDVPAWLDVLYGGANGFKSFVAFMIGALVASGCASLIKWCFTGEWLDDWT